ncbi:MAG: response regulator transcription factor [Patescibacteria group bacterium]
MSQKIFIIEDDVNILYGLQAKFRVEGFQVRISSGEEEVFEVVDSINFFEADYVVLDVVLPNMDGFEVIKKIRENIGNSLPIFVFADISENDIQSRAGDYGANCYFVKEETNIDEFASKVLKIIDNRQRAKFYR